MSDHNVTMVDFLDLCDSALHRTLDLPENWKCPKCGCDHEEGDGLIIHETVCDQLREECEFVHSNDWLQCEQCGWTGEAQLLYDLVAEKDSKKDIVTIGDILRNHNVYTERLEVDLLRHLELLMKSRDANQA